MSLHSTHGNIVFLHAACSNVVLDIKLCHSGCIIHSASGRGKQEEPDGPS